MDDLKVIHVLFFIKLGLTSSYGEISDFIVQVVTVHIENNADVEDEEGDEQVGDVWRWNMIRHPSSSRLRWNDLTWHTRDGDEGPGGEVVGLPGGRRHRDGRHVDGGLDNVDWRDDVRNVALGQHSN